MSYTAEQLRAKARNLRELGRQLAADDCEAHADALEENARLKERVALDDTEREYRRQSLANEIRETLKVRGHFAAARPSDLIGCVARAIESERDRANLAEAELAALREQLAERDAELAAIKVHAEAMAEGIESSHLEIEQEALAAYRAAYPKEIDA